jgi:putative FmdB family regulatory protein
MPIYEFYCRDCHRIFNFLSRRIDTEKRPDCPRCGHPRLERRPSLFAISKGRKEVEGEEGMPEVDDSKLERAMSAMAGELDGIDENDPRQAAHLMRRLYETAGLPVGPGMAEALARMEAGEDPDKIEQELGDVLEEDPFATTPEQRAKALRRRWLPPTVDSELYEMP